MKLSTASTAAVLSEFNLLIVQIYYIFIDVNLKK